MASAVNQYAVANAPGFLQRIEMKLLRHAMYLVALAQPDPAELALAQKVIGIGGQLPGGRLSDYAQRMAKIAATEPSLGGKVTNDVSGAEITDADLESVVATHFLKLG